jgi:hypothetical protein
MFVYSVNTFINFSLYTGLKEQKICVFFLIFKNNTIYNYVSDM